jgi:hypothetical protein
VAKASEQFRQSDVTGWGIAALVSVALAVFGSNIALMVPQSLLGGLHQPRVAGPSIETLRQQVGDLREETTRLSRENEALMTRFALQEQAGGEITRRVGALEVTVPRMLENMPVSTGVDRSTTASIGANETLTFDAEGGSVAVRQSAMPEAAPAPVLDQPIPAPVESRIATALPNENAYGVAVGAAVPFEQTEALWSDLTLKLGPLLFGLAPLVVDEAGGDDKRIVVGPIAALEEARDLCQRFERVSIACMPMPYSGTPLTVSP